MSTTIRPPVANSEIVRQLKWLRDGTGLTGKSDTHHWSLVFPEAGGAPELLTLPRRHAAEESPGFTAWQSAERRPLSPEDAAMVESELGRNVEQMRGQREQALRFGPPPTHKQAQLAARLDQAREDTYGQRLITPSDQDALSFMTRAYEDARAENITAHQSPMQLERATADSAAQLRAFAKSQESVGY